jgi:hypothetical protein
MLLIFSIVSLSSSRSLTLMSISSPFSRSCEATFPKDAVSRVVSIWAVVSPNYALPVKTSFSPIMSG